MSIRACFARDLVAHRKTTGGRDVDERTDRGVRLDIAQDQEMEESEYANIAAKLREIDRLTGWGRTKEIGELIVGHFCDGSPSKWKSHRKAPEHSLRRLAAHPDCPLAKSALNEVVGVYVLSLEEPQLCNMCEITPSHVAVVLGLEPADRRTLLEQTSTERWSVRQLRANASALRRQRGDHRGRPAAPVAHRALTQLNNATKALCSSREWLSKVEQPNALPSGDCMTLLAAIEDAEHELAALRVRVEGLHGTAGDKKLPALRPLTTTRTSENDISSDVANG